MIQCAIVAALLLAIAPEVSSATPVVVISVPGLLGEYLVEGDTRRDTLELPEFEGSLRLRFELRVHAVSLCGDPSCDVRVPGIGALGSGPIRGEADLTFFLSEIPSEALPLIRDLVGPPGAALTLGSPPPAPPCDRDRDSCGSITYNGFSNASAIGATLETPARITAASIVIRVIPEPALSLLIPLVVTPLLWDRRPRTGGGD